ncbi:MAG: hypothetical protein H6534_06080 [Chthonomonadaceae bacterium]|nr:hypothetical protein [Chthonomonadaceae bacterium]
MGLFAVIAGVVMGWSGTAPDVSQASIPNRPVVGAVLGTRFEMTEAVMEADGRSATYSQDLGSDEIRPYKFRIRDHGPGRADRTIYFRINADWDQRLDGKTLTWKPSAFSSPEDLKQKLMHLGAVRFPRGIVKVTVSTLPAGGGTASSVDFREQYSVRLEFGKVKDGTLPGKVILALPDTKKSWIAGTFRAEYRVEN